MACKFHAPMHPSYSLLCLTVALTAFSAAPAWAEKADRLKPAVIEADANGLGQLDLQKQVMVLSGNVVITKGTMVIRATKVEYTKTPGGYDKAVAFGAPGKPATFRQKRDGADEFMEGEADRLEYDGKSDIVRFINNASVRRLRGAKVADEINGNLVTYNSVTEVMDVTGGALATAANPGGRVRVVLTPREGTDAAAEAAQEAASSAEPLKQTPMLPPPKTGEKR
jgi:lipopolysaccharide export system protein LptA